MKILITILAVLSLAACGTYELKPQCEATSIKGEPILVDDCIPDPTVSNGADGAPGE